MLRRAAALVMCGLRVVHLRAELYGLVLLLQLMLVLVVK